MEISKDKLKQYKDLRIEIKLLKEQKQKIEDNIFRLLEEGVVKDKVYGGDGGIQGFVVEGFPQGEYNRRRTRLRKKHDEIIRRENDLADLADEIEKEINKIEDSRTRVIFKEIYLEGKTQQEVADELKYDRSLISKILNND